MIWKTFSLVFFHWHSTQNRGCACIPLILEMYTVESLLGLANLGLATFLGLVTRNNQYKNSTFTLLLTKFTNNLSRSGQLPFFSPLQMYKHWMPFLSGEKVKKGQHTHLVFCLLKGSLPLPNWNSIQPSHVSILQKKKLFFDRMPMSFSAQRAHDFKHRIENFAIDEKFKTS